VCAGTSPSSRLGSPFLGCCDRPGFSSRAAVWRYWGAGAAGLEVALPCAGASARGVGWRIEAAVPHGPAAGLSGANRCGERLLAAAGIRIGSRPSPKPSGLLCTGSRAPAWLGPPRLATDRPAAGVWTGIQPAGGGPNGDFRQRPTAADSERHRAPPSGVWAVRGRNPCWRPICGRSLSPAGTPLRRCVPSGRLCGLLGAGPWENGAGHQGRFNPGLGRFFFFFWGVAPGRGPSRWAVRWKATPRFKRFMTGFEDVAANGPGPASRAYPPCPAEGCAAKLPGRRPLLACPGAAGRPGRSASQGGFATAQPPEDAVDHRGRSRWLRLLQSLDGFPALGWTNSLAEWAGLTTLACLLGTSGPAAAGWKSARPWWTLPPSGRFHSRKGPAAAGTLAGVALGARRP